MQLKYANFLFSAGEAYPAFFGQRRVYNNRGRAQSLVKRIDVRGEIIAVGQLAINTRIGQILDALSLEGGSVAFLMDSGAETHIRMPAAGSRGVRIVENTLSEEEGRAHFATGHPFSIAFEAEYGIADSDPYVQYEETITKIGNGGQRTVIQELDTGQPVEQVVATNTPVVMLQDGFAVGASGYPPFPVPIYGVDNPDVSVSRSTPQLNGTTYTNFPIRWSYRKTLTADTGLTGPNYP